MIIQFNTDNNITGSEEVSAQLTTLISDKLSRFSSKLTRVEVHLVDENGDKGGQNDIRCVLEARVEGRQPIAVTSHGNSKKEAVDGAIHKLKSALDSVLGRLNEHQQ
ncbi:hypothetical protein BH09BAC1_BH09BAC1_07070 [soil metagenome]